MIQYLKIKNFGPIKDEVELSFEAILNEEMSDDIYSVIMPDGCKLLKLAYIYGANASGKTTILKAIEFLRKLLLNPLLEKSEKLDFEPFLFCEDAQTSRSSIEFAFYANQRRHVYQINFNSEAVISERLVYYQSAKPTEIFNRETDLEKRLAKIQFGSKIKVPAKERERLEANTLHNNTVLGAFAKTNADIFELEALNMWLSTFFLGMITGNSNITSPIAEMMATNPNVSTWLNTFMNKADRQITKVHTESDDTLSTILKNFDIKNTDKFPQGSVKINSSIDPATGSFTDKFKINGAAVAVTRRVEVTHETPAGSFILPIESESTGTQRYFALGAPLYMLVHSKALLLIDELENSLHPDLMKHFLQTFLANAGESQMLITTHNVGLMEEIDFIRRDALWFAEKKEDGSVDLYSAADFDSGILRKGASLVNAYRAGRLGAKPNLGSPFIPQN
ncbi:AAA family ATPase [Pedobacter hartonius]|uniref:Endonuclease GajA/Old nuclease/RecF-like AAA domain-containing protein n=1 Tax=Pedobacter hartonius TaxID=425514 RepID=A0A1H4GGF5_9SPHI|nr:ATP-binding protein [Pedobacter hartonius]SEB08703.1 hypothetical protein SAMN05443550_11039 [Pedobacter hartonius]